MSRVHQLPSSQPWAKSLKLYGLVCVCSVTQLCLTLCNPRDYSPPGFSIQGIFQPRMLEWAAVSYSKGLGSLLVKDAGILPGPTPLIKLKMQQL